MPGGKLFSRGALYLMLQNRIIYRGEIVHQGVPYPGQHGEELCDAARVATIGLDRHRRKRGFHIPGFQQNRFEAALGQAGMQPLRQRPGLNTDPLGGKP